MKKFFMIFGMLLILSACSSTQKVNTTQLNKNVIDTVQKNNTQEPKFVNPIFYQPLKPLSRVSTWTYLTPTSIKSMTPLDKNKVAMTGECELIENNQDHITLLCDISWHNPEEKGWKTKISYSIKNLSFPGCLRIEETDKSLNEEYPSISSYCVTPPNDYLSELN
ncbi:MAG: membrane lipoprotein lipid attachment site-containing protein [Alphaproteobacteria bacterium]|nr:membrane lipoprotein lipid attachment site-containing protein [Alphaproteobacteria bacterium]